MALMSRKLVVSLLLVLVLCNAAFAAHAASHLSGEVLDCELCLAHSPLSHGLTTDKASVPVPDGRAVAVPQFRPSFSWVAVRASFARGPPVLLNN